MKLIIVSIKDKTTGEYLTPVYVHNQDEAARLFKYQLSKTEIWAQNAEQFEMYELGVLDTVSGNITGIEPNKETGSNDVLHPDLIFKGSDILS